MNTAMQSKSGDAPASKGVLHLAREDLLHLEPYRHAAWEPSLERLHANELPWRPLGDNSRSGLNRYPEPQPRQLCEKLATLYGVDCSQLLVGRGSDEGIDLLVRAFCRAGRDSVMISPPTFGMYAVASRIQGAGIVEVPLRQGADFSLDTSELLDRWREGVKIVFVCSPNNPTGTLFPASDIARLCAELDGRSLVAVDEAYLEFAQSPGVSGWLRRFPNLVVLRTMSKAFALAGARCGTVLAHPEIIGLLRRMIPPYAIPSPTLDAALAALEAPARLMAARRIEEIVSERRRLAEALAQTPAVEHVWSSAANFLLVRFREADRVLAGARAGGLLVRDVRGRPELADCLRLTVGTPEQNDRLLAAVHAA
jgi:histidinol-phosphate aminotransferase